MTVRLKILLVEDNPGDADLIKEMLADHALIEGDIEEAGTLSAALSRLRSGGIDIVLLDLGLPDSSGLQGVNGIQGTAPGVPIIVLTGLDDEKMGMSAIKEGAQDYIIKNYLNSRQLTRSVFFAIERNALIKEREKLYLELKDAMTQIKTLKGIIPICANCKKIRDDKGYWGQVEIYIREHSEAEFSHGICPECKEELYGDFLKE